MKTRLNERRHAKALSREAVLSSSRLSSPLKKPKPVAERRKPPGIASKNALGPDGLRRAATFSTAC